MEPPRATTTQAIAEAQIIMATESIKVTLSGLTPAAADTAAENGVPIKIGSE